MINKTLTCKHFKYNMLVVLNIETSEEHNTRTVQYDAQWTKPALDKA